MWPGRTQKLTAPPIAEIHKLAEKYQNKKRPLINLGQATLGIAPPRAAIDQINEFLSESLEHGYSPDQGDPLVLARVTQFLKDEKGIKKAKSEQIILTCGANQAFANALLAITNPTDEIILLSPHYFDHTMMVELASCTPVLVSYHKTSSGFQIDFDALSQAITPETKAIVLVSPSNPAGSLCPLEHLQTLCQLCKDNGLWLISDETYDLLTFAPKKHISPASLNIYDKIITLGSFSKTFALASWRIGYLYGSPAFREEAIKVQDALVVCAPLPSQYAINGALSVAADFIKHALEMLESRKDILTRIVNSIPSLTASPPDGATFLFVKVPEGLSSYKYSEMLLKKTGIITIPGSVFGPSGEGYVRFSYGNKKAAVLEEAGERLEQFHLKNF